MCSQGGQYWYHTLNHHGAYNNSWNTDPVSAFDKGVECSDEKGELDVELCCDEGFIPERVGDEEGVTVGGDISSDEVASC